MEHRQLENFLNQTTVEPPKGNAPLEKISQKKIDIFCRDLLAYNPELKEKIVKQMRILEEQKLPLPVMHITSRAIRGENNSETNTGFVENIKKNGFRKRDTNVAAFVKRDKRTSLAEPSYYGAHPEKFIKSLRLFLERYLHHGLRTNKSVLDQTKNMGNGIPVIIIIAGSAPLEHGSDYDDHYILKNGATPDKIIGLINLDEHNQARSKDDIAYITEEILKYVDSFYRTEKSGAA